MIAISLLIIQTISFLDINELKVFVDLASISAGENDMDVDRVACFHDAVLGYSSMLYELKQDSGFHNFKVVLQKLWKALENDCNLPKKLVRPHTLSFCFYNIGILLLKVLFCFVAGQCTSY